MINDDILNLIAGFSTPDFFITVEFSKQSNEMPQGIESFILGKLEAIQQGTVGRKFVYQESGWRMIFTFFPTNHVVDEKYALKNKIMRQMY